MTRNALVLMTLITAVALAGCEPHDERLARMAEDSVDQQRSQNTEMAQLNREVAQGVQQLIESENESRRELTSLQHDLQEQQADVGKQRDQLEAERRQFAVQRYRESLLGPVISSVGLLLVCALPCVLAWYLLQGWRNEGDDDIAIGELLVEELVSDQPVLLPPPGPATAIADRQRLSLARQDKDDGGEDASGCD